MRTPFSRHARITSLVGTLLTAAVAGCLVSFSLVAQQTALRSNGPPRVKPVQPANREVGAPLELGRIAQLPPPGPLQGSAKDLKRRPEEPGQELVVLADPAPVEAPEPQPPAVPRDPPKESPPADPSNPPDPCPGCGPNRPSPPSKPDRPEPAGDDEDDEDDGHDEEDDDDWDDDEDEGDADDDKGHNGHGKGHDKGRGRGHDKHGDDEDDHDEDDHDDDEDGHGGHGKGHDKHGDDEGDD